jgi:DNA-binding response OmpR family regulator
MSKILLAEDDESFGYILKEYLEMNGFEVTWTKDGNDGLKKFENGLFDLCVLDIMMPEKDGFTLAKEIREIDSDVPFIFLTAKALKVDKLKGFRLGCDDYVVKPVDEELFIARVRAIINRSSAQAGQLLSDCNTFWIGKYHFNPREQTLILDKKATKLTTKETKVLKMLCQQKNQLVDRPKILKLVWGQNDFFNRKSMDVFIHKLRFKLKDDPAVKVSNVHGKGFILEDPEEVKKVY